MRRHYLSRVDMAATALGRAIYRLPRRHPSQYDTQGKVEQRLLEYGARQSPLLFGFIIHPVASVEAWTPLSGLQYLNFVAHPDRAVFYHPCADTTATF